MEKEPRIVEANIFSGNRVGNHNVVIVAVIPVLIFSAIAAIAVWPFLSTIGLLMLWLVVIAAICLALVITAAAIYACYRFRLHLQHIDRQNRLLQWEHNAGWDEGSRLRNLTQEIIEASRPLMLQSAPLEEKGGEKPTEWYDIVHMHFHENKTYKQIEAATGVKAWKIQEICADWKKKVSGSNA